MFKKTQAQESFRDRKGRFATRISAHGRADVLPPHVIDVEIEKTTLKESLKILFRERDRLYKERLKHKENSHEWNRVNESLRRVKGQLGHTEKMFREAKGKHFAVVFEFCAELLLTHEAYLMIREATHQLLGRSYKPTKESK